MPDDGGKKIDRILEAIQYLIGDNKNLRKDLREYSRLAAEDRHEKKDLIRGVRQALVIIGKRGGDFVEIQRQRGELLRQQGGQLRKLTDVAEKNSAILEAIHKGLNGKKSANGK